MKKVKDQSIQRLLKLITRERPDLTVVMAVPVLWRGWEMDDAAVIVRKQDGTRAVAMTDHGHLVIHETGKVLRMRLREYESVAEQTRAALRGRPTASRASGYPATRRSGGVARRPRGSSRRPRADTCSSPSTRASAGALAAKNRPSS